MEYHLQGSKKTKKQKTDGQPRLPYLAKFSLRNEEMKAFQDKQK